MKRFASLLVTAFFFGSSATVLCKESPKAQQASPAARVEPKAHLQVQNGHVGGVGSLSWSPNGRHLVTGPNAKLWDLASGKLLYEFGGRASWSPNGKTLAISKNKEVLLWDVATCRFRQSLKGGPIDWVNWSGEQRLVGGSDHDLKLWDAHSGRVLAIEPGIWERPIWSDNGLAFAARAKEQLNLVLVCNTHAGRYTSLKFKSPLGPLAWSPSGKVLAIAGAADKTIHLWDLVTEKELQALESPSEVSQIAWSSDGRSLVTGGKDPTVCVWDLPKGQVRISLPGHNTNYSAVTSSCSPDGKMLATIDSIDFYSGDVRLWDASTGRLVHKFDGTHGVSWSPDSTKLAVWGGHAGMGARLTLWDCRAGKALTSEPLGGRVLAWSPDGRRILGETISRTPRPLLIEVTSCKEIDLKYERHSLGTNRVYVRNGVTAVKWSPDCSKIAAVAREGVPQIFDGFSGKPLSALEGASTPVQQVSWSLDGRHLITGSLDNCLRVWDTKSGRKSFEYRPGTRQGTAPEYRWKDTNTISLNTLSEKGSVTLLDLSSFLSTNLPIDSNHYRDSWSADGKILAGRTYSKMGSSDSSGRLWESNGLLRCKLEGQGSNKGSPKLEWSPDGKLVAGSGPSSKDGSCTTLFLWETTTGRIVRKLVGHNGEIRSLSWSPDGQMIATSADDKTLRLWDAQTAQLIRSVELPASLMNFSYWSAWSPNSRFLALRKNSDSNNTSYADILLWDRLSGKSAILGQKEDRICALAWSPDSRLLGTGDELGQVQLWECPGGKKLRSLTGHTDGITALAWNPDSSLLASGSADSTTRIWHSKKGIHLLTLLGFANGSWTAVSPEGFFDGSLSGFKEAHWVIGLLPFDIEQFFNEFYQPGILKDVVAKAKPVSEILREREDPRSKLTITKKDRRPIQISFSGVPPGAKAIDKRKFALALKLVEAPADLSHKRAGGLKDVRVFNNGTLVWRSPPGQEVKSGSISFATPVVAGRNTLLAYAFNHDNVKSRDVTAVLTGSKTLERPAQAWVLGIGIDKYSDQRFNLDYAGADAKELVKAIRTNLPIANPNQNLHITALLDGQATRRGILEALAKIARQASLEDSVIVTYAGHGMNQKGRFYLLPHDLELDRDGEPLKRNALSDLDLEKAFSDMQAGHVALILDACHSGQALESEEWRVGPMNSRGLSQLAWEKNMDILAASQSNETAKEVSKLGHGLLTYALLQGFSKAPRTAGSLSMRNWLDFGAAQVPQLLGNDREIKVKAARAQRSAQRVYKKNQLLIQTPRVFHANDDSPDWMVAGVRK